MSQGSTKDLPINVGVPSEDVYSEGLITYLLSSPLSKFPWLRNLKDVQNISTEFQSLDKIDQRLYARLFARKDGWIRQKRIKYYFVKDIKASIQNLESKGFVTTDFSKEPLNDILDQLEKDEVKVICKDLKIDTKGNKKDMIAGLINRSKTQRTIMSMFGNGASSESLIIKSVKKVLDCVKLTSGPKDYFRTLLILVTYPHYRGEEAKRVSDLAKTLYEKSKGLVVFHRYNLKPVDVFKNIARFTEFEKSLHVVDTFVQLKDDKKWKECAELISQCRVDFEMFLNNDFNTQLLDELKESDMDYLTKFNSGRNYAYVLSKGIEILKKESGTWDEAIEVLSILLNQNYFLRGSKGQWYRELALVYEKKQDYEKVVAVLIEGLTDPKVSMSYTIVGLIQKAESIAKRKSLPALERNKLLSAIPNCNYDAETTTIVATSAPSSPTKSFSSSPNKNILSTPTKTFPTSPMKISTPTKGSQTTPSKDIQTTPIKRIQTTPMKDIQTTPSKVMRTNSTNSFQSSPMKSIPTSSMEGIQTTPTKSNLNSPMKGIQTTPSKNILTTPTKNIPTSPMEGIQTTPTKNIPTSPMEGIQTTLKRGITTSPMKTYGWSPSRNWSPFSSPASSPFSSPTKSRNYTPKTITITATSAPSVSTSKKQMFVKNTAEGKQYSIVEEVARSHYLSELGYSGGQHDEGKLLVHCALACFWEVIFCDIEGVFHSELQSVPLDWGTSGFYRRRQEIIEKTCEEIASMGAEKSLEISVKKYHGVVGPVDWTVFDPALLKEVQDFLICLKTDVFLRIARYILEDFRSRRSGLPDLTIWDPPSGKCSFVEVKGPSDTLSPNQIKWLEKLNEFGASAEVCRVNTLHTGPKSKPYKRKHDEVKR